MVSSHPELSKNLRPEYKMSVSNIFEFGTTRIGSEYLYPAGGNIDAGGNDVTNVDYVFCNGLTTNTQSDITVYGGDLVLDNVNLRVENAEIVLDAKTAILASATVPDTLELVATSGATVVVSNKFTTGQVYDTHFNPVYLAKGQDTLVGGSAKINVPGATPASVILCTPIGQYVGASEPIVVDTVGVPLAGDIVFKATQVGDTRSFNYVVFA